ncbi:MAG: SapC family protein [Desulfuromonadales bacterium]
MTESAPTAVLPLFYKEPVAINADQHRDLTVSPSPTGYAFAAEAHTVMLTAVEFFEACREYPIIFSPAEDGTITPLALLGIQAGENLFVDAEGAWKATYIPAYVRRYPFILADTGAADFPVCVDQTFDGLNIEGGQRLFTEEGEQTDYCRHIQAFIQDYQGQPVATAAFSAKLRELELFRPMDANIQLNDGTQFQLQGFLIVDENSLARLGDVAVLDLFRKGYLGLIYAHLASVKNLARLIDLKAAR